MAIATPPITEGLEQLLDRLTRITEVALVFAAESDNDATHVIVFLTTPDRAPEYQVYEAELAVSSLLPDWPFDLSVLYQSDTLAAGLEGILPSGSRLYFDRSG